MASSRLNIRIQKRIDPMREYPNPNGASRVDDCADGRPTETAAVKRMAFGDVIGETYNTLYANGQIVNMAHMLMCSKCCQWKPDTSFHKDRRLEGITRRGRAYYCKHCKSKHYGGH